MDLGESLDSMRLPKAANALPDSLGERKSGAIWNMTASATSLLS